MPPAFLLYIESLASANRCLLCLSTKFRIAPKILSTQGQAAGNKIN